MIKRSTGITLFLLGTGSLAMYAAARPEECRPRTGVGLTQGWHPHETEPSLECRLPPSERTSRSTSGHGRTWWGSSSSSSHASGAVPIQQTASRGGFGASGLYHSSGG